MDRNYEEQTRELASLDPILWDELQTYPLSFWEDLSENDLEKWIGSWRAENIGNIDFMIDPKILIPKYKEWRSIYLDNLEAHEKWESILKIDNFPWTACELPLNRKLIPYDELPQDYELISHDELSPKYELITYDELSSEDLPSVYEEPDPLCVSSVLDDLEFSKKIT
ncbi:MAG: hypothetical protein WCR46_00015 [Deltaproteobacteria bacterium]|jgi:hypothetical protein